MTFFTDFSLIFSPRSEGFWLWFRFWRLLYFQHAVKVARSLERRWHQIWLRSLEWQCLLEQWIQVINVTFIFHVNNHFHFSEEKNPLNADQYHFHFSWPYILKKKNYTQQIVQKTHFAKIHCDDPLSGGPEDQQVPQQVEEHQGARKVGIISMTLYSPSTSS